MSVDNIEATVVTVVFSVLGVMACLAYLVWTDAVKPAIESLRRAKRNAFEKSVLAIIKEEKRPDPYDDFVPFAIAERERKHKHAQDVATTKDAINELTATCHICGKRDFMDNLADVKWMMREEWDTYNIGTMQAFYAHPDCAKIRKSDDGKGWVRIVEFVPESVAK